MILEGKYRKSQTDLDKLCLSDMIRSKETKKSNRVNTEKENAMKRILVRLFPILVGFESNN